LLLFVAAAIMWVRSYWYSDLLSYRWPPDATDGNMRQSVSLYSDAARFSFGRTWTDASQFPVWPPGFVYDTAPSLGYDPILYTPNRAALGNVGWYHFGILIWQFQPPLAPTGKINSLVYIPYWLTIAFAILPGMQAFIKLRRRRQRVYRMSQGLCLTCGYDLRASPDRCPECGTVPRTPAKPPRRRTLLKIASLISLASLLVVGWTLRPLHVGGPVYNSGNFVANRVKSAANLRSIGQAIYLYSNDHKGDYPDSFQTLLLNEDITSGIFVNPNSNDIAAEGPTRQTIANQLAIPGHCSYVYVGCGLNDGTVTPDTVLTYEKLLHPGDSANVLFANGHVDYVDAAHIAKIIAQANSGTFPVKLPSP